MPDLHLVKPEQLTDKDMFYESAMEVVELGLAINKRAGDSLLGEYIESRKLDSTRKTVCYVQYVINKLGEEKFKRFLDGAICLPLYKQRHSPSVLNEASNYYIELIRKIILCPLFADIKN